VTITLLLLILAIVFGLYVAWNIGANDVANAVGTAVGSGALTLKQAVLIAAIFEFCGAFFLGSGVSETLESGIVNPALFTGRMQDYVFGMLASLLATGAWLQFASFFGWPVSTTHSIVGAVLGFGYAFGGIEGVYWEELGSIALSWVVSPLLGGALSYLIFSVIRVNILYDVNPVAAAKRLTPYLVFAIFGVLSLIILFNGLAHIDIHLTFLQALGVALVCGGVTACIAYFLVKRVKEPALPVRNQHLQVELSLKKAQKHLLRVEAASYGKLQSKVHDLLEGVEALTREVEVPEQAQYSEYTVVEKIFVYLQIVIACFMAFAHGSNDVANAIGPLSAIINVLQGTSIKEEGVPAWLLFLGGIGIVVGLATWGWRVIETVGKKITELTPSRGFSAGFGAATTIIVASKLGLPISTTHVLVGAVLGVGFARGIGAINLDTIRDIVISWIITVPAGAILSVLFFYTLRALFT
jgi:inorganic phosphate transporter, PiT family